MISDESDSNDPNTDTYEDLNGSTQDVEGNRDAEYASEMINDDKKFALINEE